MNYFNKKILIYSVFGVKLKHKNQNMLKIDYFR